MSTEINRHEKFVTLKQFLEETGQISPSLNTKIDIDFFQPPPSSKWLSIMALQNTVNEYSINQDRVLYFLPNLNYLIWKDMLWIALASALTRETAARIMPRTYILGVEKDIEMLKSEYQSGNWYVLKKNLEMRLGIKLVTQLEDVLSAYRKEEHFPFVAAQEYVKNAYLVNGHKINLRLYAMITYRNTQWTVYYYQSGFCYYTNIPYIHPSEHVNNDQVNIEAHITPHPRTRDRSVYEKLPYLIREFSDYLQKDGKDAEIFWKTVERQIQYCAIAYLKLLKFPDALKKQPMTMLFGLDVMIDENLHPTILEWNASHYFITSKVVWRDMLGVLNIIPQTEPSKWKEILRTV